MSDLPTHFVSTAGIIAEIPLWAYAVFAALLIIGLSVVIVLLFKKRNKKAAAPSPKKTTKRTAKTAPSNSNIPLVKTFDQLNGSLHTALLAAASINDLPVTVPIQLAIQLAKSGTCLLIDFDTKRDSIAKVFDVDTTKIIPQSRRCPISTAVDNLDLWPSHFFDQLRYVNLRRLLAEANQKYDHILLYAPYLPVLPDRRHIASCAKQAIVFSGESSNESDLYALLEASNCKIVHS